MRTVRILVSLLALLIFCGNLTECIHVAAEMHASAGGTKTAITQ